MIMGDSISSLAAEVIYCCRSDTGVLSLPRSKVAIFSQSI